MKKIAFGVIASALFSAAAHADFSSTLAWTSEYQVRGIGYSGDKPATSLSLDWYNDAGLFAGVWGTNTDGFADNDPYDDGANYEIDYYAGYNGELENGLRYGLIGYWYHFPNTKYDVDYPELGVSTGYGNFNAYYYFSGDFVNTSQDSHYVAADYTFNLPYAVDLTLTAGHSFGQYYRNTDLTGAHEYSHWQIDLKRSFGPIDTKLSWVDTDLSGDFHNDGEYLRNDGRLIFAASHTF